MNCSSGNISGHHLTGYTQWFSQQRDLPLCEPSSCCENHNRSQHAARARPQQSRFQEVPLHPYR